MPNNRNQHFVPRCYFRPFSLDAAGRAINLYNIAARRPIQHASVRGQCSRSYFYGSDSELDAHIGALETAYSEVVRRVLLDPNGACVPDLLFLRDFLAFQFARTEATIMRLTALVHGIRDVMNDVSRGNAPDFETGHSRMMSMALRAFPLVRDNIADLRPLLVINRASPDFTTSDDPVVFSSRLHADVLQTTNFGIGAMGVFFVLPLSPRLLFLCLDADTYSVTPADRTALSITTDRDVYACNELQGLNARENIYFSDWGQKDQVASHITDLEPHRSRPRLSFKTFTRDRRVGNYQTYRSASMAEAQEAQRALIGFAAHNVLPRIWMSALRLRERPRLRRTSSASFDLRDHVLRIRERGSSAT